MERIKELQRLLGVIEDGIFGKQTMTAFFRMFNLTPVQAVHFFSNVHHETGGFRISEENLVYSSAARIRAVWPSRFKTDQEAEPFVRNPIGLANKVYGGRMGNNTHGDGWKYRGRGSLQLTGRNNYEAFSAFIGENVTEWPDRVAAKYYWQSALFYFYLNSVWEIARDLSPKAIEAVRRKINGGTIGLSEVTNLINYYRKHI